MLSKQGLAGFHTGFVNLCKYNKKKNHIHQVG
jgi:hypothetical protein